MDGDAGQKALTAFLVQLGGILLEQIIALLQQGGRPRITMRREDTVTGQIGEKWGIVSGAGLF